MILNGLNREVCSKLMTTTQENKAARGTKRVCQACEVRFYDLMRTPIVCPACGAQYTLVAQPAIELAMRKAPPAKSGWRQNRPRPVEPAPDPELAAPAEFAGSDDHELAADDVAAASSDDDTVLVEQDGDDTDVTGLVELDVDPKA
jgi:uncharacterized protein (TIGR02300 family)